jgi:hypothetical protein
LDRSKVDVVTELVLDIKSFPNGVNRSNIDEFLDGVDLIIDGLIFLKPDVSCARLAQEGSLWNTVDIPNRIAFDEIFLN